MTAHNPPYDLARAAQSGGSAATAELQVRRELRYMGRCWQWVIGSEQIALWRGHFASLAPVREVFNLRIEAAWRALTGRDEQ